MTDGHNCDLMPIKSLINNKYFSNVYRFVKDHRIIYYVLFFGKHSIKYDCQFD